MYEIKICYINYFSFALFIPVAIRFVEHFSPSTFSQNYIKEVMYFETNFFSYWRRCFLGIINCRKKAHRSRLSNYFRFFFSRNFRFKKVIPLSVWQWSILQASILIGLIDISVSGTRDEITANSVAGAVSATAEYRDSRIYRFFELRDAMKCHVLVTVDVLPSSHTVNPLEYFDGNATFCQQLLLVIPRANFSPRELSANQPSRVFATGCSLVGFLSSDHLATRFSGYSSRRVFLFLRFFSSHRARFIGLICRGNWLLFNANWDWRFVILGIKLLEKYYKDMFDEESISSFVETAKKFCEIRYLKCFKIINKGDYTSLV